jgi:hypothetical protein
LPNRGPAAQNEFWKSPDASGVRPRIRSTGRAARLATAADNGSHHVYGKAGNIARLSIPIHGNRTLKIGLQRHLMKIAEIPESELD